MGGSTATPTRATLLKLPSLLLTPSNSLGPASASLILVILSTSKAREESLLVVDNRKLAYCE